jgi:GNAT superfamily N-acetyltransferase
MSIRPATPSDVPAILELIKDLAVYEKAPDAVKSTAENLHEALFGADPKVFAHVVDVDSKIVGIAIWFLNYSTWMGTHGIYLEDLYVNPAFRGQGYGMNLLKTLAQICVERGYSRLQWWVLDWNEPAINFYKSLGAVPMDEWTVFRVDGEALQKLGTSTK